MDRDRAESGDAAFVEFVDLLIRVLNATTVGDCVFVPKKYLFGLKMGPNLQPKSKFLDGLYPSTHGCISASQSNLISWRWRFQFLKCDYHSQQNRHFLQSQIFSFNQLDPTRIVALQWKQSNNKIETYDIVDDEM